MSKWRKICTSWQISTGLEDSSLLGCDVALLVKWGSDVSKVKFPSSSRVYGYSSWTLNPWQKSNTFLWSISNPLSSNTMTHPSRQSLDYTAVKSHNHAYRFHVLVLNCCILANDDPNPRCCRVTKPYGIKNVTIKTRVNAIWMLQKPEYKPYWMYIHLKCINLKIVSDNLKQTQPCVLLKNKTEHPLLMI